MKVIIAGATSLHELNSIENAFNKLGHNCIFIEASFMEKYPAFQCTKDTNKILFCNEINTKNETEDFIIIPLTEFWISYCIEKGH